MKIALFQILDNMSTCSNEYFSECYIYTVAVAMYESRLK